MKRSCYHNNTGKIICSNRSRFFNPYIQLKNSTKEPGDLYEQEAEAIANSILQPSSVENKATFFQPKPMQITSLQKKESLHSTSPFITPSVQQTLNATGQPLDRSTRSFMEQQMGYDFGNVQIHNDSLAHQSSKDINALAYTYGNHIVFAANQYQPNINSGKQLMAHELTHVVQQNSSAVNSGEGRVQLKKDRSGFNFINKTIGTNTEGKEVIIKLEIGSEEGYPEKWQAISICRMAAVEPAAVLKDIDNRWHALEVSENFYGGLYSARDFGGIAREIYALPSSAYIEVEKQKNPRSLTYASLALGIDQKDVLYNMNSTERKSGKINFNAEMAKDINGDLGHTGPENPLDSFGAGQTYAIDLNTILLNDSKLTSGVLFHEASHLSDEEFAQYWVTQYQLETKRIFVNSVQQPFNKWLSAQVPNRLSLADVELVNDVAAGVTATSEARAMYIQ